MSKHGFVADISFMATHLPFQFLILVSDLPPLKSQIVIEIKGQLNAQHDHRCFLILTIDLSGQLRHHHHEHHQLVLSLLGVQLVMKHQQMMNSMVQEMSLC